MPSPWVFSAQGGRRVVLWSSADTRAVAEGRDSRESPLAGRAVLRAFLHRPAPRPQQPPGGARGSHRLPGPAPLRLPSLLSDVVKPPDCPCHRASVLGVEDASSAGQVPVWALGPGPATGCSVHLGRRESRSCPRTHVGSWQPSSQITAPPRRRRAFSFCSATAGSRPPLHGPSWVQGLGLHWALQGCCAGPPSLQDRPHPGRGLCCSWEKRRAAVFARGHSRSSCCVRKEGGRKDAGMKQPGWIAGGIRKMDPNEIQSHKEAAVTHCPCEETQLVTNGRDSWEVPWTLPAGACGSRGHRVLLGQGHVPPPPAFELCLAGFPGWLVPRSCGEAQPSGLTPWAYSSRLSGPARVSHWLDPRNRKTGELDG